MLRLEGRFLEELRAEVADEAADVPTDADGFIALVREPSARTGRARAIRCSPGWRKRPELDEMRWFLGQEAAGEAGFDDLVAYTQVKLPPLAKLELARNYWDEMGRGNVKGMHGPMLDRLVERLELDPGDRNHRVGKPGARQRDDRDGDRAALRLAFGRRARRDRADRAGPRRLRRQGACGGSASRAASGAISISTPCST